MRVALGIGIAMTVSALGVVVFGAVDSGDWAWYGIIIVAVLCGLLADRERIFGTGKTRSARH
jgi:hypothetical protein